MATLTAAERATLTTRLEEAEAAYHSVLMGRSARVFVDQNGERIEYTASNATRLAAYIAELKRQLDCTTATGPLNLWYP